jgi:hypothetical protein
MYNTPPEAFTSPVPSKKTFSFQTASLGSESYAFRAFCDMRHKTQHNSLEALSISRLSNYCLKAFACDSVHNGVTS